MLCVDFLDLCAELAIELVQEVAVQVCGVIALILTASLMTWNTRLCLAVLAWIACALACAITLCTDQSRQSDDHLLIPAAPAESVQPSDLYTSVHKLDTAVVEVHLQQQDSLHNGK